MTNEDKKEILKAKFYNVPEDFILENFSISKEDYQELLEEGKDYLKELEGRDYA